MATRHVAQGVGAAQHRQTEREADTQVADAVVHHAGCGQCDTADADGATTWVVLRLCLSAVLFTAMVRMGDGLTDPTRSLNQLAVVMVIGSVGWGLLPILVDTSDIDAQAVAMFAIIANLAGQFGMFPDSYAYEMKNIAADGDVVLTTTGGGEFAREGKGGAPAR